VGGHSGLQATYQRIKKHFVWKGLKGDVDSFVRQCNICQQAKSERVHPAGLLWPLRVAQGVLKDISMDFIEGLPKSEGFNTILVVVDRLSKYAHLSLSSTHFSAQQIAQAIMDGVVKHHGMPRSIVSDKDKIFTSNFGKELFRLSNTTLLTSTTYHPQTDEQIERVNQCLEKFLRCCVLGAEDLGPRQILQPTVGTEEGERRRLNVKMEVAGEALVWHPSSSLSHSPPSRSLLLRVVLQFLGTPINFVSSSSAQVIDWFSLFLHHAICASQCGIVHPHELL
jgi:hypothetical protein